MAQLESIALEFDRAELLMLKVCLTRALPSLEQMADAFRDWPELAADTQREVELVRHLLASVSQAFRSMSPAAWADGVGRVGC